MSSRTKIVVLRMKEIIYMKLDGTECCQGKG